MSSSTRRREKNRLLNLKVTPDLGPTVKVRAIQKPSQVNVMMVSQGGKDSDKHMFAKTYIISGQTGQPDKAVHFVEINFGFTRKNTNSDIDYRWRLYHLTGELYVPVKIEKHLLTGDHVLMLKDTMVDPVTNSLVMRDRDEKATYGFKITADLDDKGNFSAIERERCEIEGERLAEQGKRIVAEIGRPLYTDVKISLPYNQRIWDKDFQPVRHFSPTFYIWASFKQFRKDRTYFTIAANPYKYVELPSSTYHYSPFEYSPSYSLEYLSMVAALGGDLVGQVVLNTCEFMSGYHNHKDVYPPELKEGEVEPPLQLPLPYKADPRNAKLLLLRRKYMVFITPIKKSKVKASGVTGNISFNWDDGEKWIGSCSKQSMSSTNLEPQEYIQKYVLGENVQSTFISNKVEAKRQPIYCSVKAEAEMAEKQRQTIEEQARMDRKFSRQIKGYKNFRLPAENL